MAQLNDQTKAGMEAFKEAFVVDATTGVATIDPAVFNTAVTEAGGDIETFNKTIGIVANVTAQLGGGFGLKVNEVAATDKALTSCTAVVPMGDSKNTINLDWTRERTYAGIDNRPDTVKHGVLRMGIEIPQFGRRGQIDAAIVAVAENAASLFKS